MFIDLGGSEEEQMKLSVFHTAAVTQPRVRSSGPSFEQSAWIPCLTRSLQL